MTCIVGLEHGGKVYIGGDSAGVNGWSLTVRADSKVFTRQLVSSLGGRPGEMVVGFTSSFRMGQIVQHVLDIPCVPEARNWGSVDQAEAWMVKKFIPELRRCFEAEGYQKKDNDRASGGTFLVGIAGHLFSVENDYQVGRAVCGYHAVGCGDDLAIGALHVLRASENPLGPTAQAQVALQTAEEHNAGVRGPFKVLAA